MEFRFFTDSVNIAGNDVSQDRVWCDLSKTKLRAALADGAGGIAGGARAAEMFINFFANAEEQTLAALPRSFSVVDATIVKDSLAGDTTGIFLRTQEDDLMGASVGDSEAWFISEEGELRDLTEHQIRKPLLGSGRAIATPFRARLKPGTLILASDGLTKYAKYPEMLSRIRAGRFETLTRDLVELARLPSGGLQDDLSVIVVHAEGIA